MPNRKLMTVLGIVVLGLPAAAAGANAQPSDRSVAKDVAAYATSTGVSIAEAEARLARQDEIGVLSQKLREGEPATFGGLFIEHVPAYRVVVLMTPEGTGAVGKYVAGGTLDGLVETAAVDSSLGTLEADQQRVQQQLAATDWAVDLNLKLNRVEVQIPRGEAAPQAALGGLQLPSTAVVVTGVQPRLPAVQLYGGLAVTTCTLGFTIYYGSNASNRGVATAGHCPNAQSYNGQSLTYQNDDRHSGNYDAQSHKLTGATYPNKAKDGVNSTRSITARKYWVNMNVGDFVCKWGKVTQYGCGYIVSDHDPGCQGGGDLYVKVDSDPNGSGYDLAEGGDSGGPWFLGNTAYGITSCQQGFDAIYESTGFVEGALNAHVLIAP